MKTADFFIGFILGIVTALAGSLLFLHFFTEAGISSFGTIKQLGLLGQIITLGSLLNLIVFFILVSSKKDMAAKGIILATLTLAILTIML